MIKDNIIVGGEGNKSFDKMGIALALKNSTYGGELSCSLLENTVINNCNDCNLRSICEGLEQVAQDYLDSTTKIVNSFSFQ
ncbi:MAG: hypothetical protein H7Y18_08025 [Clostridiaceae bacterium]|nr:hypothetical protein [Clostridiaceae bacterium]